MNLTQTKDQLHQFIKNIESLQDDFFSTELQKEIYAQYRDLHGKCASLSGSDMEEKFSASELKVINFLELGLENFEKFNQLIEVLSKDANKQSLDTENFALNNQNAQKWAGAKAVAEFIKTKEGFDLVNQTKRFEDYNDVELTHMFGSLFGANVASECVKSLKAEQVGRVIGYALSGLYLEDLKNYEAMRGNPTRPQLGDYLKEKINTSDAEGVYNYKAVSGGEVYASCKIKLNSASSPHALRGRNRADHTFVNEKTKTITLGFSTSNKDMSAQKQSFFTGLVAFEKMVGEPVINSMPNPYFGYQVKPYYFMAGRFLAEEPPQMSLFKATQEIGQEFLKSLSPLHPGERSELSHMQYYRLFGNASHPEVANRIAKFNTFIGGSDTQPIYEWNEKLTSEHQGKEADLNKALFQNTVGYVTNVCQIINRGGVDLSESGKDNLALYLKDIHSIGSAVFRAFNHEASAEEYKKDIAPLCVALKECVSPLDRNQSYGIQYAELYDDLVDLSEKLSSVEEFNRLMKRSATQLTLKVNWVDPVSLSEDEKPTLSDLKHLPDIMGRLAYESLHSKGAKSIKSVKSVKNAKEPSDKTPEAQTSGDNKKRSTSFKCSFLERYQLMLRNLLVNEKTPAEAKNIAYGLDNHQKYGQELKGAIQSMQKKGLTEVADFMEHTSFLLSSQKITAQRYQEKLSNLTEFLKEQDYKNLDVKKIKC